MRRGWLYFPGASFVPTNISGCILWLDGTDPAGNGSPPSDGTSISTWVDKSGQGNNFTQGTSARQPVFKTGVVNSAASIKFVRANNNYLIQSGTTFLTSGASFYMAWILTPTAISSSSYFFFQGKLNSHPPVLGLSSTTVQVAADAASWSNGLYGTTISANSTILLEYTYNGSGATTNGNFTVSVNGSSLTRTGNNSGWGSGNNALGGDNNADPTLSFDGYKSEVVFYNNIPSGSNLTLLRNYFLSRWNY